jgi:uncharacterized protein
MSMAKVCKLDLLPETYSVCRYPADELIPVHPTMADGLWAYVRTHEETCVVCAGSCPNATQIERGWRALKVRGPLEFSQVGILASIASPLALSGISIFAISTYDTDYILIKEDTLNGAISVLEKAGHQVFTG